jgi:hypothetical protein
MSEMGHSLPKREVRATFASTMIATTPRMHRHVAKVPNSEVGASPQHLPCAELISPRTARRRIPPISTLVRARESAAIASR